MRKKKAQVGAKVRIHLHGHDESAIGKVTVVKPDGHIKAVLVDEDHALHKHNDKVRELVVAPDLYEVV